MTRIGVLGVFAVVCAFAATASADQKADAKATSKAPAPAKPTAKDAKSGKDAKAAKDGKDGKAAPADDGAGDDAALGSDADPEAGMPPHITGPKTVDLGNQTSIDLPAGMILLEAAEAKKLVEQGGDTGENVVAVIASPTSSWWIAVEWEGVGYVNDDDADKLDATELLNSYKQGVTEQNVRRKELGLPAMFLDGWSEMPKYDRPTHRLLWGLKGHSDNGVSINYFTRQLGRNGYLSIDLIDSPENIEKAKVESAPVLGAIKFGAGARYEDHKDGDKDSGIGLKALVLGGAGIAVVKAAKAGIIIKLLLVFKKGIIFIVAGIAGFFRWIFGRRKQPPFDDGMGPPPTDPPSAPPPPQDPPTTPSDQG